MLFSSGSLTEHLVRMGAPALPEPYTYRLSIAHDRGGASEVTAKIGHFKRHPEDGEYWSERIRYTEVSRVDLGMAAVAAATHAYEGIVWE